MPGTDIMDELSLSTLARVFELLWYPGGGPPLDGSTFLVLSLLAGEVPLLVLVCLEDPNVGDAVDGVPVAGVDGK